MFAHVHEIELTPPRPDGATGKCIELNRQHVVKIDYDAAVAKLETIELPQKLSLVYLSNGEQLYIRSAEVYLVVEGLGGDDDGFDDDDEDEGDDDPLPPDVMHDVKRDWALCPSHN